jgi:hypothetical protein
MQHRIPIFFYFLYITKASSRLTPYRLKDKKEVSRLKNYDLISLLPVAVVVFFSWSLCCQQPFSSLVQHACAVIVSHLHHQALAEPVAHHGVTAAAFTWTESRRCSAACFFFHRNSWHGCSILDCLWTPPRGIFCGWLLCGQCLPDPCVIIAATVRKPVLWTDC